MNRQPWAIGVALFILACSLSSQTVRLHPGSPLSTPDEFARRREVELLPAERELLTYDVKDETFELFVPATVRDWAGALVWLGPGASGSPPRAWLPILEERSLLWIGANSAGNRRSPPDRINLALDAADYITRRFGVPGNKLYVGGFSGGARVAAEAALLYPDVFAGGLFIGGADYFRVIRSSDPRWSSWEPAFYAPPPSLLATARECGRYLFVAGTRDFNRYLVRDVHDALAADGFSGTEFIEVPGLGHALPPGEWFDQAASRLFDWIRRADGLPSGCSGRPTARLDRSVVPFSWRALRPSVGAQRSWAP